MPNLLLPTAREGFASAQIDWVNDDIVLVLVDDTYVRDDEHTVLDDISSGVVLWTSDPITGRTATGGVLDADDVLTDPLDPGDTVAGIYIAQDTGNPATSLLIVWFDTTAAGVPIHVDTTGAPLLVGWPSDITRIALI